MERKMYIILIFMYPWTYILVWVPCLLSLYEACPFDRNKIGEEKLRRYISL